MKFLISLKSELKKIRRTPSFYFTLAGAAFIPFLAFVDIALSGVTTPEERKAVFQSILRSDMNVLIILPIYVILVCTLIPQVEHKNNAWKQIFTSPQSKLRIYLAKFASVQMLMILFILANHFFMFFVATLIHFLYPELMIFNQGMDWKLISINAANSYVFLLATSAVQFWLGLRFKNFVVPVAIGIILWFTGTLLVLDLHTPAAKYFPYSLQVFPYFGEFKMELDTIGLISVGYALLFMLLGFADFRRRRLGE